MLHAKSLTILSACVMLCSLQGTFAQVNLLSDTADRPAQRWLPLPQGDGTDLSEQAQLLQQLRDLMSNEPEAGGSPLPKLSEQQLKEMEQALENLREQIGADKLPNLENIPKEWIDQALSNPVIRKQARQLLEQYARDRKLPVPNNKVPMKSDGVPFPRRQPNSDPKSTPNSSSKPKSPSEPSLSSLPRSGPSQGGPAQGGPARSGPAQGGSARSGSADNGPVPSESGAEKLLAPNNSGGKSSGSEESEPAAERQLPEFPDSERIEALKELFEKLKEIEGQRPIENSAPKSGSGVSSPRNAEPRSSVPGNANPNRTHPAPKPSSQGSPPDNPATARNSRNNSSTTTVPKRTSNGTASSQPQVALPNGDSDQDPKLDPPPFSPDLGVSNSASSNSASSDSASSDFGNSAPSKSGAPQSPSKPLSRPTAAGSKGLGSRPGESGPNSQARAPNPRPEFPKEVDQSPGLNSSAKPEVDIKTQLERHGLGRALQSIVEKTLKEQGESNSAVERVNNKNSSANSKPKDGQDASKASTPALPAVPPSRKTTANKSPPSNPKGSAKSNAVGTTSSVPAPTTETPNESSTMSGLRDMAAQVWRAVRSTPGEDNGESPARASDIAGGGLGDIEFVWSGRVWLLLALVGVGIVLLLLLARKRIVLATAAREAEAVLAKEILTEGIRTRADVVRAFHRFVLRRAQPVATWWNHRYVASRLTESSPQLRSVISDLASVYEHARYLPPEVELSTAEIDRVQAALIQCVACSV